MNPKAAELRRNLLVAESDLIRARLLRDLGVCTSEARALAAEGRRMKALLDLCREWVGGAQRIPISSAVPPAPQSGSPWWMAVVRCAYAMHTAWSAFKDRDRVGRGAGRLRSPDPTRHTAAR